MTYYPNNRLQSLAEAGNVLNSFDPGISVTDQQGNKIYYLYNGHGDVAGLMDANQNLAQCYEYDAFGNALGVQKDPNHSRYVGSGGVYSDDDASLQNMWNRWYDPTLGRFISRDSIGMAGGMNLYVYSKNNPLNVSDPYGLCPQGIETQPDPLWVQNSTDTDNNSSQNPLWITGSDSSATNSSGFHTGCDVAVLGTNISNDFGSSGSAQTDYIPTVIGADVYLHWGFNNSQLFKPFGGTVDSINLGASKYTGVSFSPSGVSINIGASWPPLPISVGFTGLLIHHHHPEKRKIKYYV